MDVILGGVLLSIGLAAVISLASRALKSQTDGEKEMSASWLCDELLALVVVDGPSNYSRLHDTNGQFDYPFTDFSYDLDIQSQGNDLPYVVTATVSWQGGGGPRNVQVQTIIADRKDDPNELRAPEEPIDRDQRWYGDQEENGAGTGAGGTGAPGGTGGTGGGSGGGSSTGGGTANAPR
jgi:uncharacterized membrane protein YgcG